MIRRFAFVTLPFAFLWAGLALAGGAGYPLTDGTLLEGEPISFNAQGMVVKKPDGSFATRVGWTNFTQEALKELAKQPKAKLFLEPYLEIDEADAEKKPVLEIKPKTLRRLDRPDPKAGWGSLFASPVTLTLLVLLWAGNIYAGWEVGIFRNYPPPLVAGLAAVLPVLVPVLFVCLPPRLKKTHDELAAESMAQYDEGQQPQLQVGYRGQPGEAEAEEAAANAQPKMTVYQRGQTTFNRRFFETKFAGFLKMVPGEAEKDMVIFIRSARGEHSGSRLTRVLQNELHLQVSKGDATADVIIPFSDIYEIQVRPREA
jgi:hypothetical protein